MDRFELARLLGAPARQAEASSDPCVIDERDPATFMRAFAEGCASGSPVFLADPNWGEDQRSQFHAILKHPPKADVAGRGWLMIPSGGSSGGLKFSRHDEETILSAVKGFCSHFGLSQVNPIGLLPLYHVSGLSSWMRSVVTGGTYLPWDWKELERGSYPLPAPEGACLSVVPTQLQRLLGQPKAVEWLRRFSVVFVGGGPSWPALNDAAMEADIPVSLSYGMTETFAMVAAQLPREFAEGNRSSGRTMPHATLTLEEGRVAIEGGSVHRGLYPDFSESRTFVTEDLAEIDPSGFLKVAGRRDALIITGGKKVDPLEVEAALRASGQFSDVAVVGVPDAHWGQMVTACFPGGAATPDEGRVTEAVSSLSPHQRPKRYVAIDPWPRTPQGKVNRSALAARAAAG